MAFSKCVVCLQNSAEIPPVYLEFIHPLYGKLWNELSPQMGTFKSGSDLSFPFCSPCRIYLVRVAKLNDQLESLDSELRQLQGKQIAKVQGIISLQAQVGKNNNDGQVDHETEMASNFKLKVQHKLEKLEAQQGKLEDQLENLEDQMEKLEDQMEMLEDQMGKPEELRLPQNSIRQKFLEQVQQVSGKQFIFEGKYPFERREFSFKCGSCPAISKLCKRKSLPIWYSIIRHIKKWHVGSDCIRKMKIQQKFIEIAPGRFQYGSYLVEKTDSKLRCLTCDYLASIGPGKSKFKYISIHIDRKHENPGANYICELCGAQYSSFQAVRLHKTAKHEQSGDSFPCSTCGKTFKTQFQATQHEKNIHGGRRFKYLKYICETCGKRFKDKKILQDHIAFLHNGQKLKCNDCGKTFASRNSLSIHRNSHTGKRQYICDVCGMNFTQIYSVTRHKNTAHKN